MSAVGYPVPIWLPRRRRIVSPAEWLREKLAEREAERTVTRAIAADQLPMGTATESTSITVDNAAASNSFVILIAAWFGTQTLNDSFTAAGLSFVQAVEGRGTGAGDQNLAIAYAQAASGLSTGSKDFSPAFSATPSFGPGLALVSFTGVATSSPVDVTAALVEDFNATWATNNLVTTNADDLLIAMSYQGDRTTHTAATNYTNLFSAFVGEGSQRIGGVYRIVSSTGTYTPGGTWSGGTTQLFQHNIGVAFKAASGPPPAVPNLFPVRPLRSLG